MANQTLNNNVSMLQEALVLGRFGRMRYGQSCVIDSLCYLYLFITVHDWMYCLASVSRGLDWF